MLSIKHCPKMYDVVSYRNNKRNITNKPIIYKWWFRNEIVDQLLQGLSSEIKREKISCKGNYSLLYIGCGKNGHNRLIKYHILDSNKFHQKGVANGRLSSLRQTLCGLLGYEMSTACDKINSFIDENCKVEWYEVENINDIKRMEKEEISKNYLPLNYHNTIGMLTPQHRKLLTELKKKVRR